LGRIRQSLNYTIRNISHFLKTKETIIDDEGIEETGKHVEICFLGMVSCGRVYEGVREKK